MAWLDNAGLYRKYGTEQTTVAAGGEYRTVAELREIEIKIDLTTLTDTAAIVEGADNIFFPSGVVIEQVEIVVDTAAVGATATLDIGLIQTDRSTEIDYEAFTNAMAVASLTAGNKLTLIKGSTSAGDMVGTGTATSNVGHITANYNTAPFTDGVIVVRIKYRKP